MKPLISLFALMLTLSPTLAKADVATFLHSIFSDNVDYVTRISREDFQKLSDEQIPRATVVTCSDSRIQANVFHRSPVNDLFFIRNIGNQIITTEGSVEYGVRHLHTPILLIVGHSHCGAIHAAMSDYSGESLPIRRELDHLHLSKSNDTNQGVIENVHHQVKIGLEEFKDLIAKKELIVIGTVYDFRDDFKHGHGKLILINLNGEKDPAKIEQDPLIKDIKDIAVGID